MKKVSLLAVMALFSGAVILSSCSKDDPEPQPKPYVFPFLGDWEGSYSGDMDNGTWSANFDNSGNVTGTANSVNSPGEDFPIGGKVTEAGAVWAYAIVNGDSVIFEGTAAGDSASGTWINKGFGIDGTWEGSRQ